MVAAADLPAILRSHRVSPGLVIGLGRHPDQIDAAIALLPHLHNTDLEYVINDWDRHRYQPQADPARPMPQALFDAVLEHSLTPLAAGLLAPQHQEDWTTPLDFTVGWSRWFGDGPAWRILASCPQRWRELVPRQRTFALL